MDELVAIALPSGDAWVSALERCWSETNAVFPVDVRLPADAQRTLVARMGASRLVDRSGTHRLAGGRPVEPGDALVVATSGSSGRPKGAVLTHDGLSAGAAATSQWLAIDPTSDRWLCCLPLAHVGGLGVVVRALLTGTPLEVHPGIDSARIEAAAADGATVTSLVPAVLDRIDTARFRTVLLGGSAMPPTRPPNTVSTYGMTETGGGVVYEGEPLDQVEMKVEDGQVFLRAPMLLRTYRDGSDPRTSDGWFPTGDAGSIDTEGRLRISGRLDDVIITGGENVWPLAVERAIAECPGVREVAVVGRPDAAWGEIVTAVIVPHDLDHPPTLDALREVASRSLPSHAEPRAIEVRDSLPKTTLGKIRRGRL